MVPVRSSPLTRDVILEKALVLVAEKGVDGLSMRRLAATLDVEAMSLYHHVANKQDLLDGLVERVLGRIVLPPGDQPWEARVRALAHALRDVALEHPHVFPLIATRPLRGAASLAPVDALLGALRDAGLSDEAAVRSFWALVAYQTGALLAEIGVLIGLTDEPSAGPAPGAVDALSAESYPHVHALAPIMARATFAEEFDRGLDLLLAGIREETR